MNGLSKFWTSFVTASLAVGICVSGADAVNGQSSVRAAASRVTENVAEGNPIRQDAKRRYPEIVAEVNGEKITLVQLKAESLKAHGQDVLSRILNRALVLAECRRQGIAITRTDVDAEIERLAKSFRLTRTQYLEVVEKDSSMDYQEYAEEVVWPRLALQALVADKIKLTEEELEAAYLRSYGPSVGLQMIVCATQEKAEELRSRIVDGGEDFGNVAKDESLDALTASNKGRMQPIFHGTLEDKQMEDLLFALKEGEVSQVIGPYGPQDQFVFFHCENQYDSVVSEDQIALIKDRIQVQASAAKLKSAANDLFARLGREANVVNVLADPELSKQYPNVAATIDGQPIYLDAVVEMCLKLYAEQDLGTMISIALIRQECKKVGIEVTPQDVATDVWIHAAETTAPLADGSPNIEAYLRDELEKYNCTEEYYRNAIVWPGVALRKLSEGMVKVTDEDIQKSFEANFGESVQCLGIVLNDERRAREVWQKARSLPRAQNRPLEEVFADLAAEYSVEPDGKQMRGRIAPIVRHGGYPALEEEAFSLQAGELSQVIQIDPSTFVILYCQEIIPAREVTLDDVRDQIVSNIRKMREVIAAGEFYANTVKKASIVDNITGQVVTPRQNRPEELMANPTLDTTRR
ncbi:MAG: peptidylprolyl isomerase [Thermoguttaceae bacterium]|jgi:parvulin-like peptidyl-prolyl isomerase